MIFIKLLINKKIYILLIFIIFVFCLILLILIDKGIIWFVNPERMGFNIKGIDISRYQGDINWEYVKDDNIKFVFIKATEGSSYIDPNFNKNIEQAEKNNIPNSAYHFFSSQSDGKAQAENFIKTISPYELSFPPVLDFEISQKTTDKKIIIKEVKKFCEEIKRVYNTYPIIYATNESYNYFIKDDFKDCKIWIRNLFKKPLLKDNRDWLFWQYSNRGKLKSINNYKTYVDLNVFNGTLEDFNNYINKNPKIN